MLASSCLHERPRIKLLKKLAFAHMVLKETLTGHTFLNETLRGSWAQAPESHERPQATLNTRYVLVTGCASKRLLKFIFRGSVKGFSRPREPLGVPISRIVEGGLPDLEALQNCAELRKEDSWTPLVRSSSETAVRSQETLHAQQSLPCKIPCKIPLSNKGVK